MNREISIII